MTVGNRTSSQRNAKGNLPKGGSNGLYIGGVTPAIAAGIPDGKLSRSYSGRLHSLVVNRDVVVNFGDTKDLIEEIGLAVELAACVDVQPAPPPTAPPPVVTTPTVTSAPEPTTLPPPRCAASPILDEMAYHFDGETGSRLEVGTGGNDQIMKRKYVATIFCSVCVTGFVLFSSFAIEMQIRTFASDGLVLFTGNNNLQNFVYVRLENGKVKASFGLGDKDKVAVATGRVSVNDGNWHWVCPFPCSSC